jgi:hypothetical protein
LAQNADSGREKNMLLTALTVSKKACTKKKNGLVLVIALRAQTPKHIRGGWSHYTDTSEAVD